MTTSYLFIDDDVADPADGNREAGAAGDAEAYSRALVAESNGRLTISAAQPGKLSDVLRLIKEARSQGLLLDVSFVNAGKKTGEVIAYDGITLAQQVRTLQTRSQISNFPIVRLSKRDVVREYVNGDTTSDDLFDERLEKEDVEGKRPETVEKLLALAADYPLLEQFAAGSRDLEAQAALLGLDPDRLAQVDQRSLLGSQRPGPVHNLAQYVLSAFLRRPGPLIDEALLAVRLGIDINASDDWPSVKDALTETAYRGAFSAGYPRFWMFAVTDWWTREMGPSSLKRTAAEERVATLSGHLRLGRLTAISSNADSPGRNYWNICVETGLPVDPAEGFPLVDEFGHEPWQDTDYICLETAKRQARTHKRLRPAERNRAISARSTR